MGKEEREKRHAFLAPHPLVSPLPHATYTREFQMYSPKIYTALE